MAGPGYVLYVCMTVSTQVNVSVGQKSMEAGKIIHMQLTVCVCKCVQIFAVAFKWECLFLQLVNLAEADVYW